MADDINDIREQAFTTLHDATVKQVAGALTENWASIAPLVGGNAAIPTDKEFEALARQAIDGKDLEFAMQDGRTKKVKMQELLAKLPAQEQGKMQALFSKVPPADHMHVVSSVIGDAVNDNTGMLFGSSMLNFFSAIGKWLLGFLDGTSSLSIDSFKETLARTTAENIGESAKQKLTTLHEKHPEIGMLTPDTIEQISKQTYQTSLKKAFERAELPLPAELNNEQAQAQKPMQIHTASGEVKTAVHDGVYKKVLPMVDGAITETYGKYVEKFGVDGMAAAENGSKIVNKISNFFGRGDVTKLAIMPRPDEIKNVSKIAAETVSNLLSDPDKTYNGKTISEMSKQEFAHLARNQVETKLKADTSLASFDDTKIAMVGKGIEEKLGSDQYYNELPFIPSQKMIELARKGNNPGIVGGTDTQVARSQPTPAAPAEKGAHL